MHMKIIFVAVPCLFIGCVTQSDLKQRKGWIKIATPYEISALAHARCFADNENYFVFGGIDEHGQGDHSNIGYTYVIADGSWRKWPIDGAPDPLKNFASLKVDDSIYVFGGQKALYTNGSKDLFRYSQVINRWEKVWVDPRVDSRYKLEGAKDDDALIFYGGKGDNENLETTEYNLENGSWRMFETPNEVGARVSAVLSAYLGEVLVLGGFIGSRPQDSAFILDRKSGKWHPLNNELLGPRVNAQYIVDSSKVYIIGGAPAFDAQAFGGIFDFKDRSFTEIPRIETFKDYKGFQVAKVNGEGILLWGGRSISDNTYNESWYFFKFESRSWSKLGMDNSPPGTVAGCLVANDNGAVFALGGIRLETGKGLVHQKGLWVLWP
jgi:hypothetical protein